MQYMRQTIPSIRCIEKSRTNSQWIEAVCVWRVPEIVPTERRSRQAFPIETRHAGGTSVRQQFGRYEFSGECQSHSTRFPKHQWHWRSDNGVQLANKRELFFQPSVSIWTACMCGVTHVAAMRGASTTRPMHYAATQQNIILMFYAAIAIFVYFMRRALSQSEPATRPMRMRFRAKTSFFQEKFINSASVRAVDAIRAQHFNSNKPLSAATSRHRTSPSLLAWRPLCVRAVLIVFLLFLRTENHSFALCGANMPILE